MARERSDKSKNKSPKKEERKVGKPDEGMSASPNPAERATNGDPAQQDSLPSTGRSKKRQEHQRIEEETAADVRESEPFSEPMHPTTASTTDGHQPIEDDSAHRRIAERAFSLFQERGYEHGNDWAHWFEAERQIKNTQV